MWQKVLIVLLGLNIVLAKQHLIRFDEEILNKLHVSSLSDAYEQFEITSKYVCAIECFKDKNTCTGYSFDETNNTCSLFEDATIKLDNDIIELRKQLLPNVCDNVKCKPEAVCIGEDEPKCVCINGESTPDDCDKIEIGVWSDYNDWSQCSATCGEGFQYRKRECLSTNDGKTKISNDHCLGMHTDIQPCEVTTCPTYGPWSTWTPCSTFCGIGIKQRNRSCIPPGSSCGNYTFEQRACGEANCQRVIGIKETEPDKYPMKGYLAIREGDILCIPENNTGIAKHMANLVCKAMGLSRGAQYAFTVKILDNATCYPGIVCDGTEKAFFDCKFDRSHASDKENLSAIITRCIADGGFSPWSKWSNCTKPCGTGQTKRVRTCTEPVPSILEPEIKPNDPSLAGKNCTGDNKQVKYCNTQKC